MTRIEKVRQFLRTKFGVAMASTKLTKLDIAAASFIAFLLGVGSVTLIFSAAFGSLFIAVAMFLIVAVFSIIPEKNSWVIELLGQYYGTKNAGIHCIIPGLMKVRKKWYLGDQLLSLIMDDRVDEKDGKQRGQVETDDDSVGVLAALTIRVVDPYKATYEVDNLKPAILDAVEDTTRSEFGKIPTDKIISSANELAEKIMKTHEKQLESWGVKFKQYFLKDINLSPETTQSRRERIVAESTKKKTVTIASGDREANILRGEGEGGRIERAVKATGLTAEQILGGNLTSEQAAALAKATVILNSGSPGPVNIPAATAEVQKTLDALRRSGEEEKK